MKDAMIIFRTKNVSMCSLTYVFKSLELIQHTELSHILCSMPLLWKMIPSVDGAIGFYSSEFQIELLIFSALESLAGSCISLLGNY